MENTSIQDLSNNNTQSNNLKRFQNEKSFELGYKDLLRQDPFWLENKSSEQLKPIMEKYVSDFKLTYGSVPVWYLKNGLGVSEDLVRINLHRFRIEMKFIHEKC